VAKCLRVHSGNKPDLRVKYAHFFAFLILASIQPNKDVVVKLGSSHCIIREVNKGDALTAVISLHNDETTCIRAFSDLPVSTPFVLHQIIQSGERLLYFKSNHKNYLFDPNRIFSKKGIRMTLKKYNKSYPKNLLNKIKKFSNKVLHISGIQKSSNHVIAIHNNRDGEFSILSFKDSPATSKIHVEESKDPDDFILVTKLSDFMFFKKHNQNVVLQSNSAPDDGSLSIYCQKKNIPYINIEAQNGHREIQTGMLLLCEKLL
jgi:hypothetical protein